MQFQEAARSDPEFAVKANINMGLALLSSGKIDEAIAVLRRTCELTENRVPECLDALAAAYAAAGQYPEAISAAQRQCNWPRPVAKPAWQGKSRAGWRYTAGIAPAALPNGKQTHF